MLPATVSDYGRLSTLSSFMRVPYIGDIQLAIFRLQSKKDHEFVNATMQHSAAQEFSGSGFSNPLPRVNTPQSAGRLDYKAGDGFSRVYWRPSAEICWSHL